MFAGRYFWHADKAKQARQCVEKVLSDSKKDGEALCLLVGVLFIKFQCISTVNYLESPLDFGECFNNRPLHSQGWLNLTSGNSRYERKSLQMFDLAIKLSENTDTSRWVSS